MGVRKNAKFLSPSERENYVKACVLMKADIINPGDPASAQYSKWDQYIAIHYMIQDAHAPAEGVTPVTNHVNFGHGGVGAFSFLSWHRYFLYRFELDLQSYVPGVMIPYWDWTDPTSGASAIMADDFMGPDGGAGNVVQQGYFAVNKPGAGGNSTPLPAWWPASLNGWILPDHFPITFRGGLRRNIGAISLLPDATDVQNTLAQTGYSAFQSALEAGAGLVGTTMHNGIHNWFNGHMGGSGPIVSPFDPMFYLHHCNVDRLWAMWQMDGHLNEYPTVGGNPHHHRNDIMYPWVGATGGYSTHITFTTPIPMPDFSGLGVKRNVDTLDFRALGYTYDTLPIIGIGLDSTGSMNGLTPDPMVNTDPDVTKWEAAKRGVSAFLQDCETVQNSGAIYVTAGIKTFNRTVANNFTPVFGAPNYGLIKTGTSFSKAIFDSNISSISPEGSTPLADALLDIQNTLVEAPFGSVPSDEQRYLAMLTDGMLTSGAPMNSIPDGSFSRTAIFGMGFGTGIDVDYATIASIVAKGRTLSTTQIFHGENAGTIDKFYSNALARAIGFTTIFDPVIELFAGEHTHINFHTTSADDALLITAQGMDFQDNNWLFMLHGPSGEMLYGNAMSHQHDDGCMMSCCPGPHITASRANGRLTIVIQRDHACDDCWTGVWQLMIAYKTREIDKMLMPEIGNLLFPVSAGPIRGQHYARLLIDPKQRIATRNIVQPTLHGLDVFPVSTNSNSNEACSIVVNVYTRSNLRFKLQSDVPITRVGEELMIDIMHRNPFGKVTVYNTYARLISPNIDLADLVSKDYLKDLQNETKNYSPRTDPALLLAQIEKDAEEKIIFIKDEEVKPVRHEGPPHIHVRDTKTPGVYHLGVYIEGDYFPHGKGKMKEHNHNHNDDEHQHSNKEHMEGMQGMEEMQETKPKGTGQPFTRLLNISLAVVK